MDILKLDLNKETPDLAGEGEIRFQVGLLAAIATIVVSFVARFAFGAPLIPELMAQFVFLVAPLWMVEIAVGLLGPFAKHLGFLGCTVLYLLALIAAAIGYLRFAPRQNSVRSRYVLPIAFGLLVWIFSGLALISVMGGGLFGSHLQQGVLFTALSSLAVNVVYGLAIGLAAARYIYRDAEQKIAASDVISRRRVIRAAGYAVLAVGVFDIVKSLFGSWWFSGGGRVKRGDGVFPNIDNLALEITPTSDFYQVSKNAFDPEVDVRRWKLDVAGLVDNPLSMTLDEIKSLPSIEQYATLVCISNEVGGDLIGTAKWKGVRLKDVLERAGVQQGVVDIVFRASDDYADSISLDRAMTEGTLLVYEMNGQPLTTEHGFPIRLLSPGIYGMKNVKWITKLEAVNFDFKGYWQRRGWDDRAENKTLSRIDVPDGKVTGETTIAGIAFAGDRGVSKVEVSVDGGTNWEATEIKSPLSRYTWVLWQKMWKPEKKGSHRLVVRATDGRGQIQTSQYAPPTPDGSSGYQSVTVKSD